MGRMPRWCGRARAGLYSDLGRTRLVGGTRSGWSLDSWAWEGSTDDDADDDDDGGEEVDDDDEARDLGDQVYADTEVRTTAHVHVHANGNARHQNGTENRELHRVDERVHTRALSRARRRYVLRLLHDACERVWMSM